MSNMLRNAVGWLETVRKASLSDTVIYQRGALQTTLQATAGQTDFAIDTGSGVRLESDGFDWCLTAADLILGGQPTVPQRGDQIIFGSTTYEVMAPDGQQPYQLDSTGLKLRIHTKRVG